MTPSALTPELTQKICHTIGIRVHPSIQAQLADWLATRCKALGLSNAEAYANWLAEQPTQLRQEREALSQLLTSRETYFLRDHGAMDVLREHLLKEIIEKNAATHKLSIWSLGCSTGEEAYTLGILVEQALVDLSQWHVDILGSDIDQAALKIAHLGAYRQWSFRGCSPEFIARYFREDGTTLKLLPHVKKRVRFEHLDILGDNYPSAEKGMAQADIILCRNVFIYLDDAAIQTALTKITACLSDGGFLLLAPGELHAQAHPMLLPRVFPQAMVYQKIPAAHQSVVPPPQTQPPSPLRMTPLPSSAWHPTPSLVAREVPMPQHSLAQAWTLANRGDIAAAFAMCNAVVQQQPLDPHARYLQAVLLFAQGLTPQARDALRQVLYLDPQFAVAYAMLCDVCVADNDAASALKACKQGLKALSAQAETDTVPYFKAVTFLEFKQHLQDRMAHLTQ
jgi:chemotaxis protein methyltransferase CheR